MNNGVDSGEWQRPEVVDPCAMKSNGETGCRVEGKGQLCVAEELVKVHLEEGVDDRFVVGGDGGKRVVVEFGIVVGRHHAVWTGLGLAAASGFVGGNGAIGGGDGGTARGIKFVFHGKHLFVNLAFASSLVREFVLFFVAAMDIMTLLVIVAE